MSDLAQLLRTRRDALVSRWLAKVKETLRSEQPLDEDEVLDSMHFFVDELVEAMDRGGPGLGEAGNSTAQAHGAQRQVLDRDIADVVREYGLFFQCVVEDCKENCAQPFDPNEYAFLAACLSAGAAEAVREFAKLRDIDLMRQAWEHFAFVAHEIRNPLQTAKLSVRLIRSGAGEKGLATLERSLAQLGEVVDRALMDARLRGLDAGAALHRESLDLEKLLRDAAADCGPDAETRNIRISFHVQPPVRFEADARVLRSAITNLLRNAIKFTRTGGLVSVRGRAGHIEIEDECGGLKAGDEEKIFGTFQQAGQDRSGFGLGLAIAQQAVKAHGGALRVENLPGKGCVFVVELPT